MTMPMSGVLECKELLNSLVYFAKEGKRIEAIKEVRNFTGLGLKEAKDIIDVLIPYNNPNEVSSLPKSDDQYIVVGFSKGYDFMLLQGETNKLNAFEEAKYCVENSGYTDVRVAKVVAKSRSKEIFDATS